MCNTINLKKYDHSQIHIQSESGGKVHALKDDSVGDSEQKKIHMNTCPVLNSFIGEKINKSAKLTVHRTLKMLLKSIWRNFHCL